jgi:hypothetical protein
MDGSGSRARWWRRPRTAASRWPSLPGTSTPAWCGWPWLGRASDCRVAVSQPDPNHGISWGLLTWWTADGSTCAGYYGRLVDGVIGAFAPRTEGVFLPALIASDYCRTVSPRGGDSLTARGGTVPDGYVLAFGLTSPDVTSLVVTGPTGESRRLTPSPDAHAFLAVFATPLKEPFARRFTDRFDGPLIVTATQRDGRIAKRELAPL